MYALFYWTGLFVWVSIFIAFLWLVVFEFLIVGFANSISYHKWSLSSPSSKFRWKKHTWSLLKSLVIKAATDFYAYRNRGNYTVTNQNTGAAWRGLADYDDQRSQPRE